MSDGDWHCARCSNSYRDPVRRWILSAIVSDLTGSTWVSLFNDQAQKILGGLSADEAYEASFKHPVNDNTFDQDAYDRIFANAIGSKCIFKCKVKNETNPESGEPRSKIAVHQVVTKIDYCQESKDMLKFLLSSREELCDVEEEKTITANYIQHKL
jgi:replication factor A1